MSSLIGWTHKQNDSCIITVWYSGGIVKTHKNADLYSPLFFDNNTHHNLWCVFTVIMVRTHGCEFFPKLFYEDDLAITHSITIIVWAQLWCLQCLIPSMWIMGNCIKDDKVDGWNWIFWDSVNIDIIKRPWYHFLWRVIMGLIVG